MNLLTIQDSAQFLGITRQAVHFQIKNDRIKTQRLGKKVRIAESALKKYVKSKWSRLKHFGPGEIGVREAAFRWSLTPMQVYGMIRNKILPYKRKGSLYILNCQEIETCKRLTTYLSKLSQRRTKQITGQKKMHAAKRLKPQSDIA